MSLHRARGARYDLPDSARSAVALYRGTMIETTLLLAALVPQPQAPQATPPQFHAPVRIQAGGDFVKVEAPGYAAPCWADIDGDGHEDLLVGQFNDGKIKVHRGGPGGVLAAGRWLEVDGDVAVVPGVW